MKQILAILVWSASAVFTAQAQTTRSATITVDFGRSLRPMEIDKMALGQGGLFDFQNTMRPAYFSFKLLSRLTGSVRIEIFHHDGDSRVRGMFVDPAPDPTTYPQR